jgi:hypothetical protein
MGACWQKIEKCKENQQNQNSLEEKKEKVNPLG